MMKFLSVFLIVIIPCLGRAQTVAQANSYPDSLKNVVAKSRADTAKAGALLLLADYFSDKDTAVAMQYLRQAARLAKPGSYQAALVPFYEGSVFFDTDFKRSGNAYLRAEKLLRSFPGKEALVYRSRAWHNYGALQQRQDDEKSYAEIMLRYVIPLAQKAGDSARVAGNYHNLAMIFSNQLEYKRAETYFKLAINILKKFGPGTAELADAYVFGAKNYVYLKDYPPVKPMLDSAFAILSKMKELPHLADYYMVEGMYYSRLQQYNQALASFDKGIAHATALKRTYDVQGLAVQKYFTYKAMGRYAEALPILLRIIKQTDVYPRTRNQILYHFELAETYAKLGDTKAAYEWLHKYAELADSSFTENTKTEIAALDAKFHSSEKEKRILQLQSTNEKAALTIKNNRLLSWLLAVVCVFLLAVTVMVLLFYRNNKRLWMQQKQLHDLEMQKIRQDYRISMLSAMLEGQEQERTRLARDLHDGLGGLLSSIKIELSQTVVAEEGQVKTSITRTLSHLDDAVNELRRIARSLMPEILMNYGLAEATKEFCKNLKESGINLVCQVFNYKDSLPKERQIVLYRIIQELVNNAVKHAAASQILVIIQQSGEKLFVTVEDDGKGFDPEKINGKAGAGLANVKARADFLNAKFDMQSTPQSGTSVTVECEI